MTVKYKDCWGQGFVGLYIDGVKKDQTATNNRNAEKTSVVSFSDGDELKFKDEGGNAVIWIGSIEASCGRLHKIEWCC